jgi:hypothetical protein
MLLSKPVPAIGAMQRKQPPSEHSIYWNNSHERLEEQP